MTPTIETERWSDPDTGCLVTRWTDHPSNHLYFTNAGWFDDGRQLLVVSDRRGSHDLLALDLASGEQRLLTACPPEEAICPTHVSVDAPRRRAAAQIGQRIDIVDLASGAQETIYRAPAGWSLSMLNWTADGAGICFSVGEDPGLHFDRQFEARPRCQVRRYDLASGDCAVLHERQAWLGHVNTAPGQPDLLSFCHEGPWTRVEHRVWCLQPSTGAAWKAGPELEGAACVGHEYWLADGRRIAFHGFDEAAEPVLGIIDTVDNSVWRVRQPVKTKHSHSLDGELFIGDGSDQLPAILAWRRQGEALDGPYLVCRHGGGWSEQRRHVHPRIAPDGRSVLFTSDQGGFPRVYSVALPESIASLPRV